MTRPLALRFAFCLSLPLISLLLFRNCYFGVFQSHRRSISLFISIRIGLVFYELPHLFHGETMRKESVIINM